MSFEGSNPDDPTLVRLRVASASLADLHLELAELEAAELDAKVTALTESEQATITGVKQDSVVYAAPHTREIFKVKGQIAAWREEVRYLQEKLTWERHAVAE